MSRSTWRTLSITTLALALSFTAARRLPHTRTIGTAANIGGVATAPIVAAHHDEDLVPASILMALVGYAAGNYLAIVAARWCYFLSGS